MRLVVFFREMRERERETLRQTQGDGEKRTEREREIVTATDVRTDRMTVS